MYDSQYLRTVQIWQNLNEHHYYLTSTKSVISQIDANCSPFHSLNTLPFHIRLENLKLIKDSFILISSKYYFQTGTLYLLFLSSHVFTILELDNNYFGILFWKIVKPRDHDEIKPSIEKIFQ